MNEQISIVKDPLGWIVYPGRFNRAALWFYAPGLEIYVRGEGASRQFDTIANIAANEAIARHIALISLRTVPSRENRYGGKEPAAGLPKQKLLPIYEDDITKGETEK